jgi:trans-aconitate methyltransferase
MADSSAGMLAIARTRAPDARFVQADARSLELPDRFDAAVSVFDSLNHIVTVEELRAVFDRVISRPQDGLWERSDVHLLQRCHEEQEVRDALAEAGFVDVDVVSSEEVGHRPGRLFYAARASR